MFITLLFALCSCQQQEKKASSKFNLQPNVQNIVQGTMGSILIIPANSLVYKDGTGIEESVTLELTEAYDLESIFRNGLDTRTSKDLLVTGGMINLKATTASNKKVVLADNKEITLQVGEHFSDSNNYQFFGQNEGVWADPRRPSPYLTYLPIEKQVTRYIYGKKNDEYWTENDFIFTSQKKQVKGYEFYDSSSLMTMYTSPSSRHLFKEFESLRSKNLLDKSFIASKEYEDRFLATLPNGEDNYDVHMIYFENLDKPLWVVDSMVLESLKVDLERKKQYENHKETYSYQEVLRKISVLTKFKNQYKTTLPPEHLSREDVEKLKKYYRKLKTNEFIQSYSIRKLGWHNIDYLYKDKLFSTELTIECTQKADRVAVLLKDVKVILQASEKGNGAYCLNRDQTCEIQLPKGKACAVAMREKDGILWFAHQEFTLGEATKVTLDLKQSSEAEVTKVMEGI